MPVTTDSEASLLVFLSDGRTALLCSLPLDPAHSSSDFQFVSSGNQISIVHFKVLMFMALVAWLFACSS